MSRCDITFYRSVKRQDEYNSRCGRTLRYFTDLVRDDYDKHGVPGLNCATLNKWLSGRCWEKFGITEADARNIVSQAMTDGYVEWLRTAVRRCVGRRV